MPIPYVQAARHLYDVPRHDHHTRFPTNLAFFRPLKPSFPSRLRVVLVPFPRQVYHTVPVFSKVTLLSTFLRLTNRLFSFIGFDGDGCRCDFSSKAWLKMHRGLMSNEIELVSSYYRRQIVSNYFGLITVDIVIPSALFFIFICFKIPFLQVTKLCHNVSRVTSVGGVLLVFILF